MKKWLSLLIALVLCLTALPFAMAEDEVPVIDWYIGSEPDPDVPLVNEALNEYLVEKIGCKVNITYMSSADWEQKMGTMLSSGQDCGIVGFGSQSKSDYVIESQRGSFYPLDELLEEYGQDTYALFPDAVWDGMRINGKIYGIPSKKDNGYFISLIYNADMVEDLGIDLSNLDYSNFRDLEDLFYETKEARDEKYPEMAEYPIVWSVNLFYPYFFAYETFLNDSYLAVANIDGIMDIAGYDSDTVFNFYDTDEFEAYCLQRQKLVADGIYLYDYTDKSAMRKPDHGVCYFVGWGYTYMQEHLYSEEWTSKMIMSDTIWTETNNYFSAGTAISANCAHPDLAFQVLNLVNTDPYVATMMRFGIEGIHWVRGEDGKMTFDFEGGRNRVVGERGYYYWYNAPVGNLTIVEAPESLVGPNNEMMTVMNELNDACIIPSHLGFVFDVNPVTSEIAACVNVEKEYTYALLRGQFESPEDVEANIAEFREKLHANGVDAIVEEVQRQIDAWEAAK